MERSITSSTLVITGALKTPGLQRESADLATGGNLPLYHILVTRIRRDPIHESWLARPTPTRDLSALRAAKCAHVKPSAAS